MADRPRRKCPDIPYEKAYVVPIYQSNREPLIWRMLLWRQSRPPPRIIPVLEPSHLAAIIELLSPGPFCLHRPTHFHPRKVLWTHCRHHQGLTDRGRLAIQGCPTFAGGGTIATLKTLNVCIKYDGAESPRNWPKPSRPI